MASYVMSKKFSRLLRNVAQIVANFGQLAISALSLSYRTAAFRALLDGETEPNNLASVPSGQTVRSDGSPRNAAGISRGKSRGSTSC